MKKFLHSYHAICAVLALVSVVLMVFNMYIMKETSIYVFGGYEDGITVMDGTIFTSIKINRFSAPVVSYTKQDYKLTKYKIGYYIGDEPLSIISSETSGVSDVSLIELLQNSEYSFTENHSSALHFNHKTLKNLEKMSFNIEGTTKSGEEISIKIPLNVTKIA